MREPSLALFALFALGPVTAGLAACGPSAATPATPGGGATTTGGEPAIAGPPEGTTGVCPAMKPPSASPDDDPTPAEIANCPDVDELFRGDGLGESDALPPVSPSIVPDWDLAHVREFACAYACAPEGSKVHLLAWSVIQDRRPLRNHNAVLVVEHAGGTRWTGVVMYRHATNAWWNVNISFHSPAEPIVDYDHRPTPDEIYALLDDNGWQWAPDEDWDLPAGNVIDELWPVATGAAATKHFPAAIER